MVVAKYKVAGRYLRDLRIEAGFKSRNGFVKSCDSEGSEVSYDHIAGLENGRVEPKARDLMLYHRVAGCDAIALLNIPV